MTNEKRARAFLEDLFKKIEHGDDRHREWLRNRLVAMHSDLTKVLGDAQKEKNDEIWANINEAKEIARSALTKAEERQRIAVDTDPDSFGSWDDDD